MNRKTILLIVIALCSCRKADQPPPSVPETPPDQKRGAWRGAFDRGAVYLLSRQSADGAWRSDIYGHFKPGDALTPLAVVALQRKTDSPQCSAAIDRGIAWMRRFVVDAKTSKDKEDRFVVDPKAELQYPVYTAALTIIALSDPRQKQHVKVRDAWVKFLRSHQFTGENGWRTQDWQFGGWGYAGVVPKKPLDGPIDSALEANLSATAYALTALDTAGMDYRDPLIGGAFRFVRHCQNDDGGFFFTPGDPFRNKAGMESQPGEEQRYRSYGSATADGIRCQKVVQGWDGGNCRARAHQWVFDHFPRDGEFFHHGEFAADREKDRDAAFYYYAAALSRNSEINVQRDNLNRAVVARQREDGSWKNDLNTLREDDPIVATALAMMALRWMPEQQ